jgi:hypothetical protein
LEERGKEVNHKGHEEHEGRKVGWKKGLKKRRAYAEGAGSKNEKKRKEEPKRKPKRKTKEGSRGGAEDTEKMRRRIKGKRKKGKGKRVVFTARCCNNGSGSPHKAGIKMQLP